MIRSLAEQKETGIVNAVGLSQLGQVANILASRSVFSDYQARKSLETLRRQRADLSLLGDYLSEKGVTVGDLYSDPAAWAGVTWGLVAGFLNWQLGRGYAVASVGVRLSTVKIYVKLAFQAGAVDVSEYALIRAVEGFSHKESVHVDEKRTGAGGSTRIGDKKASPVCLSTKQVKALKSRPDTEQGVRDRLLVCLLADHGLRCGEVAILRASDFNLEGGTFSFYRPKVDKIQTHKMTDDTKRAFQAYLSYALPDVCLLRGSRKGGALTSESMSERGITKRVEELGQEIGVVSLSAHDLRHYWATRAARHSPLDRLQEAGGWSSPAMPLRYIEAARVANEGVNLGED